jgi:hypothetical protein
MYIENNKVWYEERTPYDSYLKNTSNIGVTTQARFSKSAFIH